MSVALLGGMLVCGGCGETSTHPAVDRPSSPVAAQTASAVPSPTNTTPPAGEAGASVLRFYRFSSQKQCKPQLELLSRADQARKAQAAKDAGISFDHCRLLADAVTGEHPNIKIKKVGPVDGRATVVAGTDLNDRTDYYWSMVLEDGTWKIDEFGLTDGGEIYWTPL